MGKTNPTALSISTKNPKILSTNVFIVPREHYTYTKLITTILTHTTYDHLYGINEFRVAPY